MNSPMIDLVLVLGFTYLLLSILASTVYEGILTHLRARNKSLKEAIETMFFSDEWKNMVSKKVLDSPHIQALKKNEQSFPAYIPANSYAMALIGVIRNGEATDMNLEKLREKLNSDKSPITGEVREVLFNLMDSAEDYKDFIKKLEHFYDDAMDRATGWFKIRYQPIMLFIAFSLAIGMNVDTIHIGKTLWKNKSALNKMANQTSEHFQQMAHSDSTFVLTDLDGVNHIVEYNTSIDTSRIPTDSAHYILQKNATTTKIITAQLQDSGIPMGWTKDNLAEGIFPCNLGGWLIKILGWCITAAAIFLGAPFWFDLLGKIINLRSTGKKPAPTVKHTPKT